MGKWGRNTEKDWIFLWMRIVWALYIKRHFRNREQQQFSLSIGFLLFLTTSMKFCNRTSKIKKWEKLHFNIL